MGLEALAAKAISVLAPYFLISAEEFAKQAGKQTFKTAQNVAGLVQNWFKSVPSAWKALSDFERDPEAGAQAFAAELKSLLNADPERLKELRNVIEANAPVIHIMQNVKWTDTVSGAKIGRITRAKVKIEQQVERAKSVTGLETDEA